MESIVNGFESDLEANGNNIDPGALNPEDYEYKKIINYFQTKGIFKQKIICSACDKIIIFQKNKQYLDRFCFRCRSKAQPHDVKLNIRKNSISDIKIPINIIYILSFNYFLKNMGINKSYIENSYFLKNLVVPQTNTASIIKLFRILRDCIGKNFQKNVNLSRMTLNPIYLE